MSTENTQNPSTTEFSSAPKQDTANNTARPDLFSLGFPSETRDAVLDDDVTQSAIFYLQDCDKIRSTENGAPYLISEAELQKAFLYGYVAAAHKSHTLHPALFIRRTKLLNYVKQEIADTAYKKDATIMLKATGLKEDITDYFYDINEICHVTSDHLSPAFIAGYRVFFVINGRYDRCLTMAGHTLHVEVLSSLLLYRETEENARRAGARIIVNRFKTNKEQYRKTVFEGQRINDDGEPVDEYCRTIQVQ